MIELEIDITPRRAAILPSVVVVVAVAVALIGENQREKSPFGCGVGGYGFTTAKLLRDLRLSLSLSPRLELESKRQNCQLHSLLPF